MTRNSYKFLITIHAVAFQDAWPDARSTRRIYICSVMGNSKFGLDTAVTGRKRSLSYLGECSEHINLGQTLQVSISSYILHNLIPIKTKSLDHQPQI